MIRILTIVALVLTGCMELPNLENDDGVQATPVEVTEAIAKAFIVNGPDGKPDPNLNDKTAINLDETAYFSKTAQMAGGEAREFQVELFNVHNIETFQQAGKTFRAYRMLVSTLNINGDENEKPQTAEHIYDEVLPSASSAKFQSFDLSFGLKELLKITSVKAQSEKPLLSDDLASLYAFQACTPNAQTGWAPKCFNLRQWDTTDPAPLFVRKRTGCEGLKNCEMRVRHVAFDLVLENIDKESGSTVRQKTIFHFQFSPDVPFLSRITSFCQQGLGKYQDQPYVATVCNDIADFQRGTRP